jgi:hypothetical protein
MVKTWRRVHPTAYKISFCIGVKNINWPENGRQIQDVREGANSTLPRCHQAHLVRLDFCYMRQHSVRDTNNKIQWQANWHGNNKDTFGDQSMSVIDRFFTYLSSQNSHTLLTRFPSESSLFRIRHCNELWESIILTLQLRYRFCNHEYSHNRRSELFARSSTIAQQIQEIRVQPKY